MGKSLRSNFLDPAPRPWAEGEDKPPQRFERCLVLTQNILETYRGSRYRTLIRWSH